jgi:hypothetical protein
MRHFWRTGIRLIQLAFVLLVPLGLPVTSIAQGGGAVSTVYLPVVIYHPCLASGQAIWGCASQNGMFMSGVSFNLLYYDYPPTSPTSRTTTTSDANGVFGFDNVPGVDSYDAYLVEFVNSTDPARLWFWHAGLSAYPVSQHNLGIVDITNVPLYEPADGLHLTLPFTFTWGARPFSPNDSYLFVLFDPANDHHQFQTNTGHDGFLNIESLPYTIEYGVEYQWQLHIYVNNQMASEADTFQRFHVTFDAPSIAGHPGPISRLAGALFESP